MDNTIIKRQKGFGLPYGIVFDNWLFENNISKSILSFSKIGKLRILFDKHWNNN